MERTGNYRHVYEKRCFGKPKLILEIEVKWEGYGFYESGYEHLEWRAADVSDLLWLHNNGYFVKNKEAP